ncbi:hypothetical protein Dxin01_00241 [Deinococcus xinjiangensis]|uniref:Uncharacterized protein n=1 Tax=Deinococcus xinjiangensis TaxID=457454 RepID=A0ABP9V5F8_9DEIO
MTSQGGRRRKIVRLGAALAILLGLWVGLPLLALTINPKALRQQEADASALFRAAPLTALIGTVKISGPAGWNGRYLTRGWMVGHTLSLNLALDGWTFTWQGGNGLGFTRGKEQLGALCNRFSGGFDVCNFSTWKPKP